MRRFGIVGLLAGLLLLGGIGFTAYQLGVTAGATSAAVEAGATVIVPWGPGLGVGFPFMGLLFGLLFVGLVVAVVRRAAGARMGWAGGPGAGPGPWGHGGPGRWARPEDGSAPPPIDAWLGRWHQQAHSQPDPTQGTDTPAHGAGPDPARGGERPGLTPIAPRPMGNHPAGVLPRMGGCTAHDDGPGGR